MPPLESLNTDASALVNEIYEEAKTQEPEAKEGLEEASPPEKEVETPKPKEEEIIEEPKEGDPEDKTKELVTDAKDAKDPQDPKFASQFANLARKHKEMKVRTKMLEDREKDLAQRESKLKGHEQLLNTDLPKFRELMKRNPAAALRMAGLSSEEIIPVMENLNKAVIENRTDGDPHLMNLEQRLEAMERTNSELTKKLQQTEEQKQEEQLQGLIKSIVDKSNLIFVKNTPDITPELTQLIKKKFQEEGFDEGETLDAFVIRASQELENKLEKKYDSIYSIEDVRKRFNGNGTKAIEPKSEPQTMTNKHTASARVEAKKPESDEEFLEDLTKTVRELRQVQ